MALPEAPTGFALIGAYYLLFHSPLPVRWRHPLGAVALVAAVALRYEAWFFVALLLGYFLVRRNPRVSRGDLLMIATPALLFMGTWLLFTSQWGFLPNTIIAQVNKYVSRAVELDIVLVEYDSKQFLAIQAREFEDAPLVWTKKAV